MKKNSTYIALVDDHVMLRNGLATIIREFEGFEILFEADNGKQFISLLKPDAPPDIVLLDIQMPEMDGYETCLWLKKNCPGTTVLALSMYDNENAIIRMLRNGAKGYILKGAHPRELKQALTDITTKGYYYSDLVSGKLIHAINKLDDTNNPVKELVKLNERELEFLKLCCTEMTYKEIAAVMNASVRTVEGYRDALFERLGLKTRVGLAMYAIKNGIITL